MTEDTLIHFDGLQELAGKAASFHATADGEITYERFGVCTPDLLELGHGYALSSVKEAALHGKTGLDALLFAFLAGFDIGYQARLEIEQRELVKGNPTQPYDQEQDG